MLLFVQTISVRLVLNLVNIIFRSVSPDGREVRTLLFRIMSCLVLKFGTLQHLIPRIIASELTKRQLSERKTKEELAVHQSIVQGGAASGVVKPALDVVADPGDGSVASFLDSLKTDESCGTMKDIKSLVKTMTVGLKTVMWCIVNIGRATQEGS